MERWYKIGQRIAGLRASNGLTQKELADKIGVVREAIKNWENGARPIKSDVIIKLAEFFGVTTDFILCVSESKSPVDTDLSILTDRFGFSPKAAQILTILSIPQNGEWTQRKFQALNKLLEQSEFENGVLQGLAECMYFGKSTFPFEIAINEGQFPEELKSITANKDIYIRSDRSTYRSAMTYKPQHWLRIIAERFIKESERNTKRPLINGSMQMEEDNNG